MNISSFILTRTNEASIPVIFNNSSAACAANTVSCILSGHTAIAILLYI
jgi:hypothetical protein